MIDEVEAIVTVRAKTNEIIVGFGPRTIIVDKPDSIYVVALDDDADNFL